MNKQTITYTADGLEMHGDLYRGDETEPRPGVLVFPEAFGLGEHARSRAERLAAIGYIALACDLHGNGTMLSDMQEVMALMGAIRSEPSKIRARAQGAFDTLVAQEGVDTSRIAAIGFCFGGTMAIELARSGADLKAAVGFHSSLRTAHPEDAVNIKGHILVALGADDPVIEPAQRTAFEEEMRAGNVKWQMHLYGGVVHSFTNPDADKAGRPGIRYDAYADAHSWKMMLDLFDLTLA